MVKTQTKAADDIGQRGYIRPEDTSPRRRAAGTGAFDRPYAADSAYAAPRLTVQQTSARRLDARARVRRSPRGESTAMAVLITSFAVLCALGIVYCAAFAKVAAQGREIHALQQNVNAAQAQQEVLVQKLVVASSGQRIQELAQRQGMVLTGSPKFITITAPSPAVQSVDQVASIAP